MSLVFNMVGGSSGGGGGPSASDAILTVTVPTGSTVTATKGGVTLTPTMWVQAADATLDCALFVIAPAQFDATTPWTVTATRGTETASDTVTIDSNEQYDFLLSYGLLLIDNGKLLYPCSTYACTATEDTVNQVVTCAASAGYTKFWIQLTSSMLDGAYSSLVADIVYCGVQSYVGLEKPADRDLTGAGLASKWSSGAISSLTRLTVDISTLNPSLQNAFVKVGANAGTKTTASIKIKNLYLARRAV